MTDTTQLLYFIGERERIRIRRASGAPPPWTDDSILGVWSFCNVRREYDRTTRWIATNWRDPHLDDPDIWFAMVVARFVNLPDTLDAIGFPIPWQPERFLQVMAERKHRGENCYGAAYKIGTGGKAMEKPAYQVQRVFAPLWARRERLRPMADDSLLGWHARLKQHEGLSDFMAAQVVADMKCVAPLSGARDWMTFAASGPGSRRGLNRVLGRPVDAPWQEDNWRAAVSKLHETIAPDLQRIGLGDLHAQDLQNCLCEFDKMMRVKLGEGKPRRKFLPHVSNTATANTPSLGGGGATVLEAALAYAAGGLPVFPCAPSDKRPLVAGGFKGATTDANVISGWWQRWPNALIGVPTGKVFDVLDLDVKSGHDGFAAVPDWQQRSPFIARTRSGGAHLYFRSEGTVRCSTSKIAAGVDTRGVGGYVIVPPSAGYLWLNGEPDFAALPPWPDDLRLPQASSATNSGGATTEAVYAAAAKYAGQGVCEPEPAEREKIEAALAVIPSDCDYHQWFEIGCALHSELGGAGFELFDRWSRQSSAKYDAAVTAEKWTECAKISKYRAGTIFHYAGKANPDWRLRTDAAELASVATAAKVVASPPKTATKSQPAKPRLDTLLSSAADLQTMTFEPLRWIVPEYLPEGLTVLAGKPKIGKSFLALDVAAAVASGAVCLGQQCEQGDVLALFLEDSKRRLQRRLTTMLGAQKERWPARLVYATDWPRLADGGLDLIREWVGKVKKPRLVIVDILERVRKRETNKQTSQYSADYEALAALQGLAGAAQLSILVLHHQRKMGAEDLIDTVSGTLGLGGAVDAFQILGKDETGHFLYGRGRDLEAFTVAVQQDARCRWQVLGPKPDAQTSPERGRIVAALAKAGRPMTVEEIAAAVDGKRANVKNLLSKLHFDGEIERVGTGLYKPVDPQAGLGLDGEF